MKTRVFSQLFWSRLRFLWFWGALRELPFSPLLGKPSISDTPLLFFSLSSIVIFLTDGTYQPNYPSCNRLHICCVTKPSVTLIRAREKEPMAQMDRFSWRGIVRRPPLFVLIYFVLICDVLVCFVLFPSKVPSTVFLSFVVLCNIFNLH